MKEGLPRGRLSPVTPDPRRDAYQCHMQDQRLLDAAAPCRERVLPAHSVAGGEIQKEDVQRAGGVYPFQPRRPTSFY